MEIEIDREHYWNVRPIREGTYIKQKSPDVWRLAFI